MSTLFFSGSCVIVHFFTFYVHVLFEIGSYSVAQAGLLDTGNIHLKQTIKRSPLGTPLCSKMVQSLNFSLERDFQDPGVTVTFPLSTSFHPIISCPYMMCVYLYTHPCGRRALVPVNIVQSRPSSVALYITVSRVSH